MSRELAFILIVLQTGFCSGLGQHLCYIALTGRKNRWKEACIHGSLLMVMPISRLLLGRAGDAFNFCLAIIIILSIARLAYGQRNWKCILAFLQLLLISLSGELFIGYVIQLFPDFLNPFPVYNNPLENPLHVIIPNFYMLVQSFFFALCIKTIRIAICKLFPNGIKPRKPVIWAAYLRVCVLLAASVAVVVYAYQTTADQAVEAMLPVYYRALTVGGPLLIIALVYFVRDLKYLAQLRRNDTLEHQRQVSEALLINMRHFRHNLINMLYGFEGAILSGDIDQLRDYYRDMVHRCAMINNENIVALEQLDSLPFHSLLLHAIDRAQQMEIPFYLYVQKGIRIRKRLKEAELVEVMGVLLDNAIEAACESEEAQVTVEIRNVEDSCEILIRNTYPEALDPSILFSGTTSKPGHQGLGLLSCQAIIKRYRDVLLNLNVEGVYVQAQLLLL